VPEQAVPVLNFFNATDFKLQDRCGHPPLPVVRAVDHVDDQTI
jgi:hypothetical protein